MTSGPVEKAIRTRVSEGHCLCTPTRGAPFTVQRIDQDGIVLLLGQGHWATRLSWECLEGIVPFVRQQGGQVVIGGQHTTVGRPGTLDGYLKGCIKRTTAGWVAVVLEAAGVVTIVRGRPARVQLV